MRRYENIEIDNLIPYGKNARTHSEAQIEKIAKSIQEFGFINPVLIDSSYGIIAGHGRVLGAKLLGIKEVPCLFVEDLTEAQKRAYILADNKLALDAGWDDEILKQELEALQDLNFDITLTGFDLSEFNFETEDQEVIEDEIPEVEENGEPMVKPGQVYKLGNHRVMCGDSTKKEDIEKLTGGVTIDLVFTDPPYGMKKESDGVANDNLNNDDLLDFNKKWIPLTFEALKDNGSWYCWGIDEPLMDIYANILKPMQKQNKLTFRNLLTWDKGDAGAGGVSFMGKEGLRSYPVSDEKCLFVMCGVQGFNNNVDHYDETFEPIRAYMEQEAKKAGLTSKKLTELTGVQMFGHWFTKSQFGIIPEKHYKKLQDYYKGEAFTLPYNQLQQLFSGDGHETLKEAINAKRAYFDNTHDKMKTVWEFGRVKGEERATTGGHATPKPIALCARAIKSSSRERENVLDVFGGSGSTLIACEQLNRNAYIMELEPKWCDVIIKRWEQLTGNKCELIKDGEKND